MQGVEGNVEEEAELVHFSFLPGAEMTAGIRVPKQCLMQECLQAECHATGYSMRHREMERRKPC